MAVEAAERRYLHLPPQAKDLRQARIKALVEGRKEDLARLRQHGRPPRFFHNDLHDLESLWWIALWKLLQHNFKPETSCASIEAEEQAKQREVVISLLFPQTNNTVKRRLFLQTNVHYWDYLALWPDHTLKTALAGLRSTLVKKYSMFEAAFPDLRANVVDGTHSLFRDLFAKCRNYIRKLCPGLACRRMGLKIIRAPFRKLEAAGVGYPVGVENSFRACSPSLGADCENRFQKKGKRKRDSIEEVPPARPAQIAR